MFELASLLLLLQNALAELEEKVAALEALVRRGESMQQEAPREETRREAELLTSRLRTLKGSLLELQRMLQDKHQHLQVSAVCYQCHSCLCIAGIICERNSPKCCCYCVCV